jgi:hypothetical protein
MLVDALWRRKSLPNLVERTVGPKERRARRTRLVKTNNFFICFKTILYQK